MMSKNWMGQNVVEWTFEGHKAILVCPQTPAKGKPWAIYTEYFGAFPNTAEALLKAGWYIAGLENDHRWGSDEDQNRRHAFLMYLVQTYGLSAQCVPIGMSCGGLHAIRYAALWPGDIQAMFLDAPVVNLLSCPLGYGNLKRNEEVADECLKALGMTELEMLSYRKHPLDGIPVLVQNRIPIILLWGTEDHEVPYEENGKLLEQKYKEKMAPIQVICKPGCAHHPHGLEDPTPIVEFLRHTLT